MKKLICRAPVQAGNKQEPAAAPADNPPGWAEQEMSQESMKPLSEAAAAEYNALKQQYPDVLIGFEQDGSFEFYGEDARTVADVMELDLWQMSWNWI